ncbi:hypothetical protein KSP40_PGU002880 [Platanthera guangdongensis]|uniref:25S rRNA (uridine-N(3))-methyltransferase BMT5-like domain-containing protein n=1 Tax=Platanthera guangdongensis TaxID=2320717 RepID=A0ABR2LFP5_9ASPA
MGRKRKRERRPPAVIPSSSPSSPTRKKTRSGSERYSSSHLLLLVGEGDFSFSLSLANTFGSATNIVATSKDSQVDVQAKYGMAKRNLDALKTMGALIFHDVDAITMDHHTVLRFFRFDRIIFNFPHAGFMVSIQNFSPFLSSLHRQLVLGFFRTAANMIKPHGEIHVSHKTGEPYDKWKLEELAAKCSLRLIECSQFRSSDYPGYANKRGAGKSPDLAFRLGSCCTFKFKFYDARQELDRLRKSLVPRNGV